MVIIEGRRWVVDFRLVFFPDESELQQLLQFLPPNGILRVRQATIDRLNGPKPVQRSVFRTSCIDLTKTLETLYGEMDAKSCRYEIRKAEKIQARIETRRNDGIACEDFLKLYNRFVSLKGHTHPLSRRRFQEYVKVSDVFVIYLDGRPMCGHLLVRDDTVKRSRLIFSASGRLERGEDSRLSGALNRYLHWHEFQTYKRKGFVLYDFGGIGDGSGSIGKFKLSFGGFRVQDYSYVFAGALGVIPYKLYQSLWRSAVRLRSLRYQRN